MKFSERIIRNVNEYNAKKCWNVMIKLKWSYKNMDTHKSICYQMLNYIYNHLDLTHFAFNNDAICLAVVSSSFIDDIGERIPRLIKRCSKNVSPLLHYSFHHYRFVTMKKLIYYSCQYTKLRNVRRKLPYILIWSRLDEFRSHFNTFFCKW